MSSQRVQTTEEKGCVRGFEPEGCHQRRAVRNHQPSHPRMERRALLSHYARHGQHFR